MLRIDACNRTGITMQQLAQKIGYTREYLQAIKAGKKGQTLENLEKISCALGCTPAELLPLAWQAPSAVSEETKNKIARVIMVYEQLKLKYKNLTPLDVARVIMAVTQVSSATILSDEEITRYFHITALK